VTGYRVERCTGTSCSTFAEVGAPATTAFADSGLTAATSYSYRVRAKDAAGNLSAYSAIASATTPDTSVPSAPTNLTAVAVSGTQINLSWTASTDNVGVTGYRIERCAGTGCTSYVQVASPTATTYSDTGLVTATNFSYRVRATDAAGNLSPYSNTASATTQTVADTQAPSTPTGLTASTASGTQINLTWSASTDNIGVSGYLVERCAGVSCSNFAQVAAPTSTNLSDTSLLTGTTYSYRVRAADAAGNLSGYSTTATATTGAVVSTYTYDATGHLKTVTTGSSTVTYTYDTAGNLTGIQKTP
jgi:YD repeat-containing protein